jgi:lactate dehydrogenase-like 2-hydroxyacid dehydrogenase
VSRPVVVVTRRLPAAVEEAVSKDFEARLNREDRPLSPAELQEALRSADALLPTVTDKITADVLSVEPLRAKMIANFGVGFNNIDVAAAKARGIAVSNTPDVLTEATADLAMTLLLAVARRVGEGERLVRGNRWTGWGPTHLLGRMVSGKTLGLIGMGRIARAVARRAHHGFGMRVLYTDPYPPPPEVAKELGAEQRATIEEVLAQSDFVSLHCPATPDTRHLMNGVRLAKMKPSAYLINTARGDVVDEQALIEALTKGWLAGAGLDVFEREPQVSAALLVMENVVLLPHLGSATEETRVAMGMRALENLRLHFAGSPLRDRVA